MSIFLRKYTWKQKIYFRKTIFQKGKKNIKQILFAKRNEFHLNTLKISKILHLWAGIKNFGVSKILFYLLYVLLIKYWQYFESIRWYQTLVMHFKCSLFLHILLIKITNLKIYHTHLYILQTNEMLIEFEQTFKDKTMEYKLVSSGLHYRWVWALFFELRFQK